MRKNVLKIVGIALMIVGSSCIAKAECDDFIAMSYQEKFECALKKATETTPLLIMDFENLNAWEAVQKETDALKTSVLEDFESYSKYMKAFQSEGGSSDVSMYFVDGDATESSPSEVSFNSSNKMVLDDERIASLKIASIMQKEYKLASIEQKNDGSVKSMDLSYSKVMDDFFKDVKNKTDVKQISLEFINNFLKEPCENVIAKENFETRRLMLYRETIKETAGLAYHAQVRSLDWADLLDDFNADLASYTEKGDINKITRLNFLSRQFMSRLFAVYAQSRAVQAELRAVSRMFNDNTILYRRTMEYATEQLKDIKG